MSGWSVDPAGAASEAGRAALVSGLIAFNEAQAGPAGYGSLAVYVRDPLGAIAGGLEGRTSFGWLYVDLLFLPEPVRRAGLGRRILAAAEDEAIRRGCRRARLETASYQARGFYERQGYRVFGELDGYPGDHRLLFMRKDLPSGPVE